MPKITIKAFDEYSKKEIGERKRHYKRRFNLTIDDWFLVCFFYVNTCLRCGQRMGNAFHLTVDHVNGDSGDNRLSNFQPLCYQCNTKKGSKDRDFRWDKGGLMIQWIEATQELLTLQVQQMTIDFFPASIDMLKNDNGSMFRNLPDLVQLELEI